MSSGTEVIVFAPLAILAGGALAAGAVVAGGAYGVAYGAGHVAYGTGVAAYAAAQHMEHEYQAAMKAYHDRVDAEQAELAASRQRHSAATRSARALASRTRIKATDDANAAFFVSGLDQVVSRLGDLPDVGPELAAQCQALRVAIERNPEDITPHCETYDAICEAVSVLASKHRISLANSSRPEALTQLNAQLAAELDMLSSTLDSPLLARDEATALRVELQRRLLEVRHMAETQPRMAEQGLRLLRGRVQRVLLEQAKREQTRLEKEEAQSARRREMAGHVAARCQAVIQSLLAPNIAGQPKVAELRTEAESMLQRLARVVASELGDELLPLVSLQEAAEKLFKETHVRLEEIALQSYIESQVVEVFGELGYSVSEVPAAEGVHGKGYMASVDKNTGLHLVVDGAGTLTSELVAFSDKAAEIDLDLQDGVCKLMDSVFDGLAERGHTVRENRRRHLKPGRHRLRVVERKKVAVKEEIRHHVEVPLTRRMGE